MTDTTQAPWPLKVLLAEDEPELRERLARLLGADGRVSIVATAAQGRQVLDLLQVHSVDIVLLDVEMPIMDGVETAQRLSRRHPRVKVVMYTAFERQERLSAAMAAGAVAFLTKDMPPEEVINGLLRIHAGERLLSARATESALEALRHLGEQRQESERWFSLVESLNTGQREVYEVLITGASNREIAECVAYSEGTVRVYVTQILDALGCRSRTEVVLNAARAQARVH